MEENTAERRQHTLRALPKERVGRTHKKIRGYAHHEEEKTQKAAANLGTHGEMDLRVEILQTLLKIDL